MKFFFSSILVLLLSGSNLYATGDILRGHYKHGAGSTLYLYSFYGLSTILTDSCKVGKKGEFAFSDRQYPTGFYRLSHSTGYTDCILEKGQMTVIDFMEEKLSGEMLVKKGNSQKGLAELKAYKTTLKAKIAATNAADKKPSKTLAEEDEKNTARILNRYKGSYFEQTARLALPEKPDPSILPQYKGDTLAYFSDHFFDQVDFTNDALVHSTLLPNLYMRYLSRYVEYDEPGFKKAVDLILSKAAASTVVYNLSLEYLMEVFEKAGPEVILEYVIQQYYLENSCGELESTAGVREKIAQYRKLLPGENAPPLEACTDKNGNTTSLDSILYQNPGAQSIVLFFWSTHCQFCRQLLDTIQQASIQPGVLLVGVNINENINEWNDYGLADKKSFVNLHTSGGWEARAARTYMVNKTPTIYLLNRDKKIAAKNLGLADVLPLLGK